MSLTTALKLTFRTLLDWEPARMLGIVAAAATALAALLDAGDVHTWQAALPVFLAEAIRRLVYSPESVHDLIGDLSNDEL